MVRDYPGHGRRHLGNQLPELGDRRPGEMGAATATCACASIRRGAGRSPGVIDHHSTRETQDFHDCIEWAGAAAVVQRQGSGSPASPTTPRNQWRVAALQPPHLAAHLRVGRLCRPLPRLDAPRRHPLHLPEALAGHAGEDRAARRRRARAEEPRDRRAGVRPGDAVGRGARAEPHAAVGRDRRPRRWTTSTTGTARPTGTDHGAAAVLRQLGRQRAAPARQHRGISARGLGAEMARDARRHALDRLLHRLCRRAAEAASSTISSRASRTAGTGSRRSSSRCATPARRSCCA